MRKISVVILKILKRPGVCVVSLGLGWVGRGGYKLNCWPHQVCPWLNLAVLSCQLKYPLRVPRRNNNTKDVRISVFRLDFSRSLEFGLLALAPFPVSIRSSIQSYPYERPRLFKYYSFALSETNHLEYAKRWFTPVSYPFPTFKYVI